MTSDSAVSYLRRRSSMVSAVAPSELFIPTKQQSSSFSFPTTNGGGDHSSFSFELMSLRSSLAYTSLKDLIPPSASAVASPTGCTTPGYEIPIKNHLVKQAAWAYLQPMSISPDSTNRHPFRQIWVRFSRDYVRNPVNACLSFINRRIIPTITKVFDRLLGAIRVRINKRRLVRAARRASATSDS